ncbi:LexA family protein [Klebsiella grimontii]|uniref:LexA family protein n=1 Tax=Klebsiella grimontii TaxID=2058152 RepID=UPI0012B92CC2|nr:S24 family peptidase [Klebsiella grimontii]
MIIDDSFYKRIAIARTALGITQGKLADMVGIGRRQVASYEGGNSKPRDTVLQNLAAALGTSTEWLAQGIGKGPDVSSIKRTVTVQEIPVYSNASSLWLDPLIDGEPSVTDFIQTPIRDREGLFALRINGDSMASSGPFSFPEGTIVTFDPNKEVKHGDFVLCVLDGANEATFKQLVIDQQQKYLKALNPAYPLIPFGKDSSIIGVAVHSQKPILNPEISLAFKQGIGLPSFEEWNSSQQPKGVGLGEFPHPEEDINKLRYAIQVQQEMIEKQDDMLEKVASIVEKLINKKIIHEDSDKKKPT